MWKGWGVLASFTDEAQRLLLDQIAEGVALVDAAGDQFPILEINSAYRRMLADPTRSLVGLPWRDAFPNAEEHGILDIFRRVRDSGLPFEARDFAYHRAPSPRHATLQGGLTYWDWKCLPLRGAGGAVERMLVIVTDVTERHRHERGRALNARLIELTPIGIAVTTGPGHTITLGNARVAELLDVAPSDLAGRPLFTALPRLAGTTFAAALERVYRTGEPFTVDDFAFATAGAEAAREGAAGETWHFWRLAVMPLPGLDGAVEGLVIMALDTTPQVRARRQMEELAAAAQRRAGQLEAVIASMADGVFILDAGGVVLETNDAGMALLGLPRDARARRFNDYLLPLNPRRGDGRSLDPGTDLLAGVLAGEIVPDEQLLLDTPGRETDSGEGERVVSFSAAPVREGNGRVGGAVVLLRDITAQKRLDQEKDAFLSLISHEVKSPLTAIKGFAQLARWGTAQVEGGERVGRHLDVIEQQIERVTRLVNDLAEASRLQQGTLRQEPVDFDLAPAVRNLVDQQQVAIATHRLELTIADEPLPVHADPTRIEQVLTNLLTNAVKYSPDADRVAVTLRRDGPSAHLTVRDQGIGIPRAEQGRLFGRFYRASNAGRGGGLGLGLFIAHEIILRNGGRIWVESEEGRGSTFHVTLPLLAARERGSVDRESVGT